MRRALFISCGLALGACAAPAQAQTNIAPQAERILSAACQYLAEAPFFTLNAEVWREHVNATGQKLQFSRTVSMDVNVPTVCTWRLLHRIRNGVFGMTASQ